MNTKFLSYEAMKKAKTKQLLSELNKTYCWYYDWSGEEHCDAEVEMYAMLLKYVLSHREHVYSKGENNFIRKIMAKYRLKRDQAIQYIRDHKIKMAL